MGKRAAIYARVSTDEQSSNFSLPTQVEACRKYAEEQGYAVVGEFRDDFTGTELQRPGLDDLRMLVDFDGVDVVVCYDLDRLARKALLQGLIEDEFERRGVTIEYVLGHYEPTPEGQFMKQIRAAVAELERKKILERMDRGRKGRAKAGHPLPGTQAPYGYRYISEPHGGRLEIDDQEVEIVRLVFKWYVAGDENGVPLSAGAIARKLSNMQIPTRFDTLGKRKGKRAAGTWGSPMIINMLSNESYIGQWHYPSAAARARRRPSTARVRSGFP